MSTMENSKHFNPGKYVKDVLIMYLREMFKNNADNIGIEGLDETLDAGIFIGEKASYDSESIGERPVILISSSWRFSGTNPNRVTSFRREDNMITYSDLITSPVVIVVGSRAGLEAEYIASMAANFLAMDTRSLTSLGIHSVSTPVVGSETNSNEFPELKVVPIQLIATIQSFWTARPLPAEKLNYIKSTLTIGG